MPRSRSSLGPVDGPNATKPRGPALVHPSPSKLAVHVWMCLQVFCNRCVPSSQCVPFFDQVLQRMDPWINSYRIHLIHLRLGNPFWRTRTAGRPAPIGTSGHPGHVRDAKDLGEKTTRSAVLRLHAMVISPPLVAPAVSTQYPGPKIHRVIGERSAKLSRALDICHWWSPLCRTAPKHLAPKGSTTPFTRCEHCVLPNVKANLPF